MKVPMKWLREYVDCALTTEQYADKMGMAGNAVEEIIRLSDAFSGVVVGEVVDCQNQEGSDHLHICKVDVGREAPIQVVCGAPNVRTGALVPVALPGAKLSGGATIKAGKLRGVESQGMLCSGTELGIPDGLYPHVGDEGLLIFNERYPVGVDVRGIVGMDDNVVDFEILANRPDCLSIWGIARESAAVLDTHCVMPEIVALENAALKPVADYASVEVLDSELCPRYCARVIDNVRIGPSPMWMREYLNACGVRPINNVVDITNFVMLETGHPMHAFDLGKVEGRKIIVRRAHQDEKLTTLDGKQHRLTDAMLVIADAENATGLAGIMGGEESEITAETKSVLFECAAFDRTGTRLTSRALGIRTESGGRFERGVRAETAYEAIQRACMLVNMLECGDVAPGVIDIYPNPAPPTEVLASVRRINERISTELSGEQMEDILLRLGIDVTLDGDELRCVIPEWRGDITMEADLSEEVLRLYGYHHIPSTLPSGAVMAGFRSRAQLLSDRAKQTLIGLGFYEAMGFSFVSRKWLAALCLEGGDWRLDPVVVRNPLGEDTSVMRTSLVPSMLAALSTNINRGNAQGALFELSAVFKKHEGQELPDEPRVLCMGLYGGPIVDFYAMKDAVCCMLQRFGIGPEFEKGGDPYLHPGRKAIVRCGGTVIGQMGEVHPDVAQSFEIEGRRVYIAELMLDQIAACEKEIEPTKPLPKFPAVTRDLALVMDESVGVGAVMSQIRAAAGKRIENVQMFDIYRGAQLGAGKKSVAFALSFRADDRTLTDDDIQKAVARILAAVEENFGAVLRG